MLGVDYDCAFADLDSVPKHKAPYVKDGDQIIEDSHFIRMYFEDKLGKLLDEALPEEERAIGWALERMAEDHLAKYMLMARWLDDDNFNKGPATFFMSVPEEARQTVINKARSDVNEGLYNEGFGRHSEAERMAMVARDIDAIACQLGGGAFLFGDNPSAADAAVSAVLTSCATPFFNSPLVGMVAAYDNLAAYIKRIDTRFFSKNNWPYTAP